MHSVFSWRLRQIAIAAAVATFSTNAMASEISLQEINIQLFYATTGTLSKNIGSPSQFNAWNTIIGEGDAAEPASDLLVTVRLVAQKDEANSMVPLNILVKSENGKILGQRKIKNLFLKGGRSIQAVFVPNATCAGHLTVEAVFGPEKKSTSIDLNCGE